MISEAENAVWEMRTEDAELLLRRAEASFGCGPLVDAPLVHRMWLAEGVMLSLIGDESAAADSFAAASRDINVWNDNYGPQYQARLSIEAEAADRGRGVIDLEPPIERYRGAVDGKIVDFPYRTSAGLHVVQVGPPGFDVQFGRIVYLAPEQEITLSTGLVEPEQETIEPHVGELLQGVAQSRPTDHQEVMSSVVEMLRDCSDDRLPYYRIIAERQKDDARTLTLASYGVCAQRLGHHEPARTALDEALDKELDEPLKALDPSLYKAAKKARRKAK